MSFPCSVQETQEAADFPFNHSSLLRESVSVKQHRGYWCEEEGKAAAAAEALHVWWNVDQENNGVTCAVIRR